MSALPDGLIDAAATEVVMQFGGRPQRVRQEVEVALQRALAWLNDPANDTESEYLLERLIEARIERHDYNVAMSEG